MGGGNYSYELLLMGLCASYAQVSRIEVPRLVWSLLPLHPQRHLQHQPYHIKQSFERTSSQPHCSRRAG